MITLCGTLKSHNVPCQTHGHHIFLHDHCVLLHYHPKLWCPFCVPYIIDHVMMSRSYSGFILISHNILLWYCRMVIFRSCSAIKSRSSETNIYGNMHEEDIDISGITISLRVSIPYTFPRQRAARELISQCL